MIHLTLAMITKNEEANIARCLLSVKGLVNEILIVDTGSTDKTIDIAESLGANIIPVKVEPFSFAKARNIALKYALGTWILQLDADEELHPDSVLIIERLIETEVNTGFICQITNLLPNNETGDFNAIRLFKRHEQARYERDCHEDIFPSLNRLKYEVVNSEVRIIHHGYNCPQKDMEKKALRNLGILQDCYRAQPHWIYEFQIGETYLVLGKGIAAREYFRRALRDPGCSPAIRDSINLIMEADNTPQIIP